MSNGLIPQVEIFDENGRPTPSARVDPGVLQFLMQAVATAQLIKMRKIEESKIPIGLKQLHVTVDDTIHEYVLDQPWISMSAINDGPSSVTIWVNDQADPLQDGMIAINETFNCDFTYPIIHTVYVKATTGGSASIRIYGRVGKKI